MTISTAGENPIPGQSVSVSRAHDKESPMPSLDAASTSFTDLLDAVSSAPIMAASGISKGITTALPPNSASFGASPERTQSGRAPPPRTPSCGSNNSGGSRGNQSSSLPANGIGVYFHPCDKEEVSAPGVSPIREVTATSKIYTSNHMSTCTPD